MSAPFCTGCGATIAAGTRFCVKCGQPIGHAAPPPPVAQTSILPPPPPPSPMAATETHSWTPPPPPPPVAQPVVHQTYVPQPVPQPYAPQPVPQVVKGGSGAGLWIGIFAVLLLLGGAGGYWYLVMRPAAHTDSTVQVATGPTGTTSAAAPVQPPPQPTPDPAAAPTPESSTLVPAPTPNPTTDVIPPNPDFAKKAPSQPKSQPPQTAPAAAPPPASDPPPARPQRAAQQTSGVLHATVEVAQNGEVVFENLPGARLKFTFDHALWQPTISHQASGTQTLVMRSLKQGIQTSCDVRWEIVQ